jgi:hypothetical protein
LEGSKKGTLKDYSGREINSHSAKNSYKYIYSSKANDSLSSHYSEIGSEFQMFSDEKLDELAEGVWEKLTKN